MKKLLEIDSNDKKPGAISNIMLGSAAHVTSVRYVVSDWSFIRSRHCQKLLTFMDFEEVTPKHKWIKTWHATGKAMV